MGLEKYVAEIEFWEKYQRIQDNTDEFVKQELNREMSGKEEIRKEQCIRIQEILDKLGIDRDAQDVTQLLDWGLTYEEINDGRLLMGYLRQMSKFEEEK